MPELMSFGCGNVGHKEFMSLGVNPWFINTPACSSFWRGVKTRTFTRPGSQAGLILYTAWAQFYTILISVAGVFVHTFHRAYKEISNSKKGIL